MSPLFLGGCVTSPAPQGQTYTAGYVGDRDALAMDEMVFTVNLVQNQSRGLHNLHVRLDAVVNPKDVSLSSSYDVTGIIRRVEPRIQARLADLLPPGKTVSLQELPAIKDEIAREASATFLASYSKWTKASAYDVQIVVAAFYLTDLSVGLPAKTRSFW